MNHAESDNATDFFNSLLAFHAVLASYQKLPGVPPAWWYRVDQEPPKLAVVKCWAAGEIQDAIEYNDRANDHKGDTLNRSIMWAVAGILFAGLAVIGQL